MQDFLKRFGIPLLLVAALVYVGYSANSGSCVFTSLMGGSAAASAEGAPAPQWELPLVGSDDAFSSDELEGKVAVVNFWATWCPPCVAEIPHFVKIQKELKDKDVQFVGISVDQGPVSDVQRFAQEKNINYPVVMADDQVVGKFGGFRSIPTTFIIDASGQVRKKFTGYVAEEDLRSVLMQLVDERNTQD